MKNGILTILACLLLTACSAGETPFPGAGFTQAPGIPAAQPTIQPGRSTDTFILEAWVSNPEPEGDEQIVINGSLIKNNTVYLGGIMMQAFWEDRENPPGLPNCNVLMLYQRGICPLRVGKFPRGVYVPVKIVIDYYGTRYTGETGFTPK